MRASVVEFINEFNSAMNRYFRGQALVAALTGLLFAVCFGVVGLPMGILLGLFIGLLNMVPYLQIVGLIPVALIAVIKGLDPESSIGVAGWVVLVGVIFAVVQIIQDGFLVPKIMGKVTGLSPAIILLSISVWGKLLGFFGLIIALPMTCLVLAYYQRLIRQTSDHQPLSPSTPDIS
jgi:predicted PurR-regulated permease PerM